MCFSGGGYRAATFHLGALSYLHRAGLSTRLVALSTVSGGSFTGARYALSQVEGKSFEEFFAEFYRRLADTHLVELGLARLGQDFPLPPSGRHDLSIAIADVYAEAFFSDADGQPYRMGDLIEADIGLEQVIINTTEFRHAEAFVFARGTGSGSSRLPLDSGDAAKVRVADAVAASACFPGGFEPFVFPHDFRWPDDRVPEATRARYTEGDEPRPVGIMDGGIFDNQGTESLLVATEAGGDELDLTIVSDADREEPELYSCAPTRGRSGWRLRSLSSFSWLLVVLASVNTVSVAIELIRKVTDNDIGSTWEAVGLFMPLVLAAAVLACLWWVRRQVFTVVLPQVPQVGLASGRDLGRIRLQPLVEMLELRLNSLLALTSNIYLRRIRTLGYRALTDDPDHADKHIANEITNLRDGAPFDPLPGVDPPSPALRRVANIAAETGTLLWYERDEEQPCLVAAGQATLCVGLMRYLVGRFGDDPGSHPEDIKQLWATLVNDWRSLCDDPYKLLTGLLPNETPARPDDGENEASKT